MDTSSTAQTVAQAVQAATQAAQQASQSPQLQVQPTAQSSSIDNLTCQWQGCGERCDSAESLYDHVCERHVGRKSTNNLNLTCQWGACRTTTVKRDHITSHIRVHVPLKPHKCDFCGKAFKRPQDLKKHVKTHADESVLNMSSPTHGANGRGGMNAAPLGQPNAFPPAGGYYGHDGLTNPYSAYSAMGNGGTPAYPPPANNGQYAGYGSVSYPNSTGAMQDLQSYDTRRRAIEALNDFLGDIRRREIDPSKYYDVGSRLQSNTLPLPIPVGSGYNTGYNNSSNYNNNFSNTASLLESFNNGGSSGSTTVHNPVSSHAGYSLPMNNARTKNDLQDIDRFLEQLQTTVYEASNQASAAGVVQNGVHNTYAGGDFNFGGHAQGTGRGSNSPSGSSSMGGNSAIGSLPNMAVSQGGVGTPALTPASISSYDSAGHSPLSSHGRTSLGQMYPNLPTVPSTSHIGSDYPTTTSAPPSSLAYGMDFDSRRYSGGQLQRQAPQSQSEDTEMADALTEDGSRTPKASQQQGKSHSSIDPALRADNEDSKSPSDSASSSGGLDAAEKWLVNARTIEALRNWISQRLKDGEYEDGNGNSNTENGAGSSGQHDDDKEMKSDHHDDAGAEGGEPAAANDSAKNMEIAKLVEQRLADAVAGAKAEEAAVAAAAGQQEGEDVKYPTLPSS